MKKEWTVDSWKNYKAAQQPNWETLEIYPQVLKKIQQYPPLVFAGEVRSLKAQLAQAAQGNGFLIQGGDCAETFDEFKSDII